MIASRRSALLALGGLAAAACGPAPAAAPMVTPPRPLPPRPPVPPWPARRPDALAGTAFLERIRDLVGPLRDERILAELEEGNVPRFMRSFVALPLTEGEGTAAAKVTQAWVLPDYLCVGSDDDFLRVPMLASTAQRIVDALGCVLPTPHLVDIIFRHARHLPPVALEAGPLMVSSDAYRLQDERVEAARTKLGTALGALVAGHKKDIVICARLSAGRLAIYGFHRADGEPVQPLSLVHSTKYVDYAQGVRLVHRAVCIEGRERAVADVLADAADAHWLSDEGAFSLPRYG
ncbi:MAG: hypothetical protein WKG00_01015 [Polyangiaceae bacterium]